MSIHPNDLLRLASELQLNAKQDEVCARSAASRAYYAGLLATGQLFPDRVRTPGESSHEAIIACAVAHGKSLKPGRTLASQISQALSKMKRQRNRADYEIQNDDFTHEDSEGVILRAQSVMRMCVELSEKLASGDQSVQSG